MQFAPRRVPSISVWVVRPRALPLFLALLTIFAASEARSAAISDRVTFSTTGQALFGSNQGQGEAVKTITFGSTPVFKDTRGPVTGGQIYHLDQPIPVEAAQQIWQAAVNACRTQITRTQTISVDIPVFGTVSRSCRGSVTPTESQCINGGTIKPRLSATCCIYGGTYPNCKNGLGPDTVTVSTNQLSFNVGSGIGPPARRTSNGDTSNASSKPS